MNYPLSTSAGLESFWPWLIESSLHGAGLAVIALVLLAVFRRQLVPRARYYLLLLVLIRLLLPSVPESRSSIFNLAHRFGAEDVSPSENPRVAMPLSQPPMNGSIALPVTIEPTRTEREWSILAPLKVAWFLGCAALLISALCQQWRWGRWARIQPPLENPRIDRLMQQACAATKLRKAIPVLPNREISTPALFGFFNPRLIFPEQRLAELSDPELRSVLIHELIHLRRRDVLLNWVLIAVQALHWFNPLVWLAFKRLRTERELFCDAQVLRLLETDAQSAYGSALIKLASGARPPGFCAALVPIINHKNELKRRITMISHHTKTTRLAWGFSLALILMVSVSTLSRATERQATEEAPTTGEKSPAREQTHPLLTGVAGQMQPQARREALVKLEDLLQKSETEVKRAQTEMEMLRQERLPQGLDVQEDKAWNPALKRIAILDQDRTQAMSELIQLRTLLQELDSHGLIDLRQILPTTVPDPLLANRLDRVSAAEGELARLRVDRGLDSAEVHSSMFVLAKLNEDIDFRVKGILAGLRAKLSAFERREAALRHEMEQEQAKLTSQMDMAKPYFDARRAYEERRRIHESLQLRLLQEQVDAQLR
jgi:beta-lactamase regulating signal transducer with metallopeptidase domain